jgi:hypothetical protein
MTARTGRRGRYVSFAEAAAPPDSGFSPEVGRLVLDLALRDGRQRFDASGWPCPRLTRTIIEVLRQEILDKDLGRRTSLALFASMRAFVSLVGRVAARPRSGARPVRAA